MKTKVLVCAVVCVLAAGCWENRPGSNSNELNNNQSNTNENTNTSYCGDGILDDGEDCDATNLAGLTCANLGFDDGELRVNTTRLSRRSRSNPKDHAEYGGSWAPCGVAAVGIP
jgi:hypothetical protein